MKIDKIYGMFKLNRVSKKNLAKITKNKYNYPLNPKILSKKN